MGFNDLIASAASCGVASFSNCTVSVTTSGVEIFNFRAVFDRPAKAVQMFDGSIETSTPRLTALESDLTELAIDYVLVVTPDDEVIGTEYQVTGAPEPDGMGFVVQNLTKDF